MLRIEIANEAINLLQEDALNQGGRGTQLAGTIMAMRGAFANMATAFNRQQQSAKAKKPELVIADGKAATIRDALAPSGRHGWPKRSGRLLQGLALSKRRSLDPARPEDYMCMLTMGPPQQRRFGAHCAVFVYDHARLTGTIAWLGREAEVEVGFDCAARM